MFITSWIVGNKKGISERLIPLLLMLILSGWSSVCRAEAQDDQSLTGVWQGTLGSQTITACFNASEYGRQQGSYYYHRHLTPIHLERERADGDFGEDQDTGRWQVKAAGDGQSAGGVWLRSNGSNPMPIILHRLSYDDHERRPDDLDVYPMPPCGSDAYNLALEKPLPVRVGPVRTFNGQKYRILSVTLPNTGSLDALELLSNQLDYKAVNGYLRRGIDEGDLFACRRQALMWNGGQGSLEVHMPSIALWGKRWLTYELFHDTYCGGAHPDGGTEQITLELASGKPVALASWFKDQPSPSTSLVVASSALNRLILKKFHPAEPECVDILKSNDSYGVSLAQTRMVFATALPHVTQACTEVIEVPYAALQPFLSHLGKKEVASLLRGHY